MQLNEYQQRASETAQFDERSVHPMAYVALGLAGETGEVVEKVKKLFRNDKGDISEGKREDLAKELGDVLWYLSQLAHLLDLPLEHVAQVNLDKLKSRVEREVIKSEGDDR